MYTYEYERIRCKGVLGTKFEDHKEGIARRAKNGWRYVTFIPAVQAGHGFITEMDLIFEKEL